MRRQAVIVETMRQQYSDTDSASPGQCPPLRVAYVPLIFPAISETFVSNEILALRELGWQVQIYPLWSKRPTMIHDNVWPLLADVHRRHPLSPSALGAMVRSLVRSPRRFLSALGIILADVRHRPKRVLKGLGLFPVMAWIAEELQRQDIRHVHAHFASYPALAGMVLQRLAGVTYSFTAHAFDIYVDPSQLDEKVDNAAFVATPSEYNRRLLASRTRRGTPVHVVRCGVRVPDSLPEMPGGPVEIVSVGRLVEKKGQSYLIDACALLRDRGIDVHCVMIGDGPDRPMLEHRIAQAGLTGRVELAGPRTADEVAGALRQATVFVLPSIVTGSGNAEGLPLALEEAMAAGVTVLSTRVTGIPELVDDGVNGVLVDPGSATQLADALERLIVSPEERERLRRAAFETVRSEFGLLQNARKLSGHLAEALRHVGSEPDSSGTGYY